MLEKVFFNLLDNSIRHGQHVTEIRVSCSVGTTSLEILWEDNGTGIAVDEKEKIFERGYGKKYRAWNVPCARNPGPDRDYYHREWYGRTVPGSDLPFL